MRNFMHYHSSKESLLAQKYDLIEKYISSEKKFILTSLQKMLRMKEN